jgi:hypothetical protein
MQPPAHAPRAAAIAATSAALLVFLIYLLRLDRIAGLVVDDGWYVLLARALAEGRGFKLISSAAAEILPVVPPGFPVVLAVIFRLTSGFPSNVLWLKAVSIASMLGAGAVTGYYLVRWRQQPWPVALTMAVATTLVPAFVFLATSTVMAECVFMLGQMASVVLIEWSAGGREESWIRRTSIAAVVAAVTTLLRATGLALLAAGVLYLLYRRLPRRAVAFMVVAIVCMLPWTVYARLNASTLPQRMEHGGSIVFPYTESMRFRLAADPLSGQATARDIVIRLGGNIATIFGKDLIGVLFPAALRGATESGEEVISIGSVGVLPGSMGNAPSTIAISLALGALMLLGWVVTCRSNATVAEFLVPLSIAMFVTISYQMFRYTLTLTPFLLFYLTKGLNRAFASQSPSRIVLLCVVGFALLDHVQYIRAKFGETSGQTVEWLADSAEIEQVLGWMNDRLEPGPVATTNPPLVYLRTGRKTLAMGDITHRWRGWKARGIRYLVCLVPAELPSPFEVSYKLLYQTSRHKLWVIEI